MFGYQCRPQAGDASELYQQKDDLTEPTPEWFLEDREVYSPEYSFPFPHATPRMPSLLSLPYNTTQAE